MNALKLILGIQIFFAFVSFCVIIYLIIRRLKKSKEEMFEKRDN
ncbi:MAG: hypothetical protein R6U65_12195 [Perlabentimonas sp.]